MSAQPSECLSGQNHSGKVGGVVRGALQVGPDANEGGFLKVRSAETDRGEDVLDLARFVEHTQRQDRLRGEKASRCLARHEIVGLLRLDEMIT